MKFKQATHTVFLDPGVAVEIPKSGVKLDIVLSPSLYWVKKVSLPVKYLRDVKKLLPSLFEEILPAGNYSYSAYKEGDEYYIFAYEDKKILELLAQKNINLADIKGVYFAQAEFASLKEPLKINNTQSLYLKDEIVIITPSVWFGEDIKTLYLDEHVCQSRPIRLQQYGHIVDHGSLYKIAAILSALIVIVIVEIFITKHKTAAMEAKKEQVFSKYHLKATMMQNRAILSKYKTIYEKQTKLRTAIGYFLKLPLSKGQSITLMEYKNKALRVLIKNMKKQDENRFLSSLKKQGFSYKVKYTANQAEVEVKI